MVVYYNASKHVSEYRIMDENGQVIAGQKPTFPLVGLGSIILGLMLAITPTVFITALMYIIGAILVLGAINQFMVLVRARRFGGIGFGYWIFPSIILLTGLYVIIKPMSPASIAMSILGWCSLLYGVTEIINSLKVHSNKRKAEKAQEIPIAEEVKEDDKKVTEVTTLP
jgi:uncharacterized membrane protein HdeD (DUF308 family)